jgi:Gluconolactonase
MVMRAVILMILLSIGHMLFAQQVVFDSLGIIKSGATLQRISNEFSFTEGPVADQYGNVYFTDQPNNRIWYYDVEKNALKVFKDNAGRANGLAIDAAGNIIACADENNELWAIAPDGEVKVLVSSMNGKKLNGPNDLWIDKKGGIYFTDPYYQRNYWSRTEPEIKEQKVYYLPKGATKPIGVTDELVKPNGIVGSADGKYLFVADIDGHKIYRFDIRPDGSLGNKHLFAPQGADGITLDEKGNLYLAGRGVTVYNPHGVRIAHIPVPEKWTANICFAGKNKDILFITASNSIYILKMNVKGQ